jgi:hypothetical protein
MPHDHDQFRAGYLAGKFNAADDVGIDDVSGYAYRKNIAQTLIENEFRGSAAIDTAEYHREWPLAFTSIVHLLQQIAAGFKIVHKPLVAFLQYLQGSQGRDRTLSFKGMRFHRDLGRRLRGRKYRGRAGYV